MPYSIPIIPPTVKEEEEQFVTLVYALLYHGRCLASIINDTMNVTLMDLSNTFRSYQDDLLAALYNLPRDQSFITNSTEQTLANLKPYLGTYLVPESSLKNDAFMSNAYSVGQVLETIANDWIGIREDLKCATTQTKDIMNAIISDLREVYVNNPEYSQTLKLMNSLGQFGINQDDSLRDYCQACVLASQLVVNCIDHGLLLNIVLIPSTTSFFMIDVLKSAIKFLLPSLSEAAEQQFQRDLNRLMSTFLNDGTWTICDYRYAIKNPTLVVASIRRVLSAIDLLLQQLPVYNHLEPILRDAQANLQQSVLCTPENAKTCLAPFPHNVVECREVYDMVFMEKAHYRANPMQVQKRRWAYNLNNVVSFMTANKLKSNALLNDDVLPMLNMILDMK